MLALDAGGVRACADEYLTAVDPWTVTVLPMSFVRLYGRSLLWNSAYLRRVGACVAMGCPRALFLMLHVHFVMLTSCCVSQVGVDLRVAEMLQFN